MNEQQIPTPPEPPTPPTPSSKGTSGLDPKIAGLLAYLFGWVSGLVIYLIEKEDKEVRFHALQSIALSIVLVAFAVIVSIITAILIPLAAFSGLGFLFRIFMLFIQVVYLGVFVLWIFLMVKAYNQEHFKLPIIGDMVEKYV